MNKTCSLDLSTLDQLDLTARQAEIVHWQGRDCLRLNGLAILPCPALEEGRIEVLVPVFIDHMKKGALPPVSKFSPCAAG